MLIYIVWGNCNQQDNQDIEKLPMEAGRIVTGATKSASTNSITWKAGWESLSYRRY